MSELNERISLGGFGIGGVFRYEGLRLPGLDGPSNLIIAASKPPPPPPPPAPPPVQDYDSSDDGSLGLSGFNIGHIIGAPVRLAGHALAPLAKAAGKTGIPQWTNRHLIKPIVEPALKAAALVAIDVESAGIHTLINTFVPTPVSNLLHGLTSVAVGEIKDGVEGRPQLSPEAIVHTMVGALTFLGAGTSVVQALFDAAFELKLKPSAIAPAITYMLANWAPPPGKTLSAKTQEELVGAKATYDTQIQDPLRGIFTTAVKLIADIATSGKVRKSDLQGIVGNGSVIDKIMGLFGVHDGPPADVLTNIEKTVPPPMQPAMKKAASAAVFAAATGGNATTAANLVLASHPTTQHLVQHPAPPAPPTQRLVPPHHHRPHGPVQMPGPAPLPTPPMASDYAPYPAVTR
jgi:hypothetical protein